MISVIDTTTAKKLADIKIDSDNVEAMALEKPGQRLFANVTGRDYVAVIDRDKRSIVAKWPTGQVAKHLVAMALDEPDHRLFTTTRQPGKLIVLNSDSGKVLASYPSVSVIDDMSYDPGTKRIYICGNRFCGCLPAAGRRPLRTDRSCPGFFPRQNSHSSAAIESVPPCRPASRRSGCRSTRLLR